MTRQEQKPLLLQNDFTVWLEADHPSFLTVRQQLNEFADLVKSPSHIHTYRISSLSLWNAAALGKRLEEIVAFLSQNSKWGIPKMVHEQIVIWMNRYGCLKLIRQEGKLMLVSAQHKLLPELFKLPSRGGFIKQWVTEDLVEIHATYRGLLKQEFLKSGYPIEDQLGYHAGEAFPIQLKHHLANGDRLQLRDYQWSAVDAFYRRGSEDQGSGVIVLPCGSGKTIIGLAIMERLSCATLILTTNTTSVKQWKTEILEKTTVTEEQIGEYCGSLKQVRPITIATYQILTHRKSKEDLFTHMELFQQRDWGFIIYDEVHLLPAPIFRATADIQATRRLGLTATLVREDGREEDVFSLIGPKRHDVPWKRLEAQGWIAKATCIEVLIELSDEERSLYENAENKDKFRIACENSSKQSVVSTIITQHQEDSILIIGQYVDQLEILSSCLGVPLICGKTPHEERERLYNLFKSGVLKQLIVSKVANFAVDLPNAAVAIQISGSFGSRQEEAQRLGRIMRPMVGSNDAYFYSLVTEDSKEQVFSQKRQLFLIEQGYEYLQKAVGTLYNDLPNERLLMEKC
ncbi:DEAD/DEAH box helicase [Paenibacillus psychroresistens]|uniref:DNA 3'-5' helicase n=1 Tax=Paenibacillus psychroresistens TaxID=1778678 RepID=A0A6B8RNR5_9BACL|nr:DNA repair helicase XPB [Paenibacillus psychroresistens]QGQ96958.1 DEAD/DEAH box helicase [Paenibacillus psychroresistens]